MKKTILLCLNQNLDKDLVKKDLQNNHFADFDMKKYAFRTIYKFSEYNELINNYEAREHIHCIVVHHHLTAKEWGGGQSENKDYGIEFIKNEIRLKDNYFCRLPVIIYSVLPKEGVLKNRITDNEIINTEALGHYFLHSLEKAKSLDLNKLRPLSPVELAHARLYCSYIGMVASIRHDYQNRDNQDSCLLKLKEIYSSLDLEIEIPTTPAETSVEAVREICNRLEELLLNNKKDSLSSLKTKTKVLLLDDAPDTKTKDQITLLIKRGKKIGLEIVHKTKTQDAISAIEQDEKNEYSVLIADYKILDANGEMTQEQGYRFLEKAANTGNIYKYMSFSYMPRAFRLQVASLLNNQLEHISKELYLPSEKGQEALLERISELAEFNNYDIIKNGPNHPVFKLYYATLKRDKGIDFEKIEKKISELTTNCINAFDQIYNKDYTELSNKEKGIKLKNELKTTLFEKSKIYTQLVAKETYEWTNILPIRTDVFMPASGKNNFDQQLTNFITKIIVFSIRENNKIDKFTSNIEVLKNRPEFYNFFELQSNPNIPKELLDYITGYLKNKTKLKENLVNYTISALNADLKKITEQIKTQLSNTRTSKEPEIITSLRSFQDKEIAIDPSASKEHIKNKLPAFILNLVNRRFTLYLFYQFGELKKQIKSNKIIGENKEKIKVLENKYVNSINYFIEKGFLPTMDEKGKKITANHLWISAKVDKIAQFSDIRFTIEEDVFFKKMQINTKQ